MANITGWTQPNTVQQNNTGSAITVPNAQRGDFLVAIADAGGTLLRPNIEITGGELETLFDGLTSPLYEHTTTTCKIVWHWRWPWYRYYWWYRQYYGYYWWYPYHWWYRHPTKVCKQDTTRETAMTRAVMVRLESAGPLTLTASATLSDGSVDRFTVYHFRPTVEAASGKTIQKVTWVPRAALAQQNTSDGNQHIFHATAKDLVFTLAAGNDGDGISITPSGNAPTNLINQTFAYQTKVRTVVRLDYFNSAGDVTYTFTKLDVARFLQGYAADIREVYADFPTTGSVYWVAVPARVNASLKPEYPSEIETLMRQASTLDPVSFGLEYTFPRGSYQTKEDASGQVSVESYDELHILRFPDSISLSTSIGDILLDDSELESYIAALEAGW